MNVEALRVALFSGNYGYTRDGAAQSLQRLVGHLVRHGAAVRIYSPTVDTPAFPPNGQVVHIPSVRVPRRPEYRVPVMLPARARRDLLGFAPNILHIASPDIVGHRAVTLARRLDLPAVASVHTRFETYPRYYGLGFLEPLMLAALRRFYRRCDAIFAPSASMARLLRQQGMNNQIGIWTRGIDDEIFNPGRRDVGWRRSLGIADDDPVVGFVGRVVMEKALDVFVDSIESLAARKIRHRVVVVGDGPARPWLQAKLPDAVFTGFRQGPELGRAVASLDVLFNPSVTETFGNVTLEAMASGVPVVAAIATGSESLVTDGVTGRLVPPQAIDRFAQALAFYCGNEGPRRMAGRAGWQASRRYTWDEVNAALVKAYLRAIAQHGSRRAASPAGARRPTR